MYCNICIWLFFFGCLHIVKICFPFTQESRIETAKYWIPNFLVYQGQIPVPALCALCIVQCLLNGKVTPSVGYYCPSTWFFCAYTRATKLYLPIRTVCLLPNKYYLPKKFISHLPSPRQVFIFI